jgi:hypothetical protein
MDFGHGKYRISVKQICLNGFFNGCSIRFFVFLGTLWLRMVENLWFSIIFLRVSPINLSYCGGRARGFWPVAIFWRCSMSFSWIHDGMTKTYPEMFGIHRTFWQTLIPLAYDISVAVGADAVDDILSSPFWLTSGFLNAIAMDGTPVIAHLYLHIAMCHCLHAWSLFHPLNHLNPSVLGRVIPPKQAGLMQSLLPTTNPTSHIQPLSSIEPDTYSKRFFPCHHPYNYSIAIFVCYNAIYIIIYILCIYTYVFCNLLLFNFVSYCHLRYSLMFTWAVFKTFRHYILNLQLRCLNHTWKHHVIPHIFSCGKLTYLLKMTYL